MINFQQQKSIYISEFLQKAHTDETLPSLAPTLMQRIFHHKFNQITISTQPRTISLGLLLSNGILKKNSENTLSQNSWTNEN